jgi:hypothetical protein
MPDHPSTPGPWADGYVAAAPDGGMSANAQGAGYSAVGQTPASSAGNPSEIAAARTGADTQQTDAIAPDPIGNALFAGGLGIGASAGIADAVGESVVPAVLTDISAAFAAEDTAAVGEITGDAVLSALPTFSGAEEDAGAGWTHDQEYGPATAASGGDEVGSGAPTNVATDATMSVDPGISSDLGVSLDPGIQVDAGGFTSN